MTRDFTQLAQSQNRAIWAKAQPPAGVSAAYIDKLTVAADRQQARFLAERRERLEKAIRECSDEPQKFWWNRYFRGLKRGFASTPEAVTAILYEINWEWNRPSYNRDRARIEMLKTEALVLARFFRRNSRKVWAERRAA